MIGLTNAGLGLNETSVESKIENFNQTVVQPAITNLKTYRGYNIAVPTATTFTAAWNTEHRLGTVTQAIIVALPEPDYTISGFSDVLQTVESRFTFIAGAGSSINVAMLNGASSCYNIIWPDSNPITEGLKSGSLYEISLAPITTGVSSADKGYIVGYCKEITLT